MLKRKHGPEKWAAVFGKGHAEKKACHDPEKWTPVFGKDHAQAKGLGKGAMTLAPLLNAPLVIQVHALAAMSAFVLGLVQFTAPKGTLPHRTVGWIWVVLMLTIALSSFWIHEIRLVGPFSPIHLLSILTLVTVPLAVYAARHHRVQSHRKAMTSIFLGALVVAGAFTFLPGRIMYKLVFGG